MKTETRGGVDRSLTCHVDESDVVRGALQRRVAVRIVSVLVAAALAPIALLFARQPIQVAADLLVLHRDEVAVALAARYEVVEQIVLQGQGALLSDLDGGVGDGLEALEQVGAL